MSAEHTLISPGDFSLEFLRQVYAGPQHYVLAPECRTAVAAAHQSVADIIAADRTVYGINTGFGLLAKTRISNAELNTLQTNLVLSHSTGVGDPLPDEIVRLVMVLKVGSLAQGHSGVCLDLIESLLELVNNEAYPVIPAKGSVGASGDLAPLAHLSAALIGHGQIRINQEIKPAQEVLKFLGLKPFELGPKEGLALLNGTQVSTALALAGLFRTERAFVAALTAGAMSVDAVQGSDTPFDGRIHQVRGQQGQIIVAEQLREVLSGSEIRQSHAQCDRVQDPYCLRCQPQVMGAVLDVIQDASKRLLTEANAVTDNPLVFGEDVLSGGNFHAEPVAFAADMLAMALAEIGNISERRVALLVDPNMSGLPAFLVENGGVNSGFMIAHVTAAALASENKQLSHPAVVDTIPTSANQEDHVSMATHGARRLLEMTENTANIVGIELLCAAQGIDFQRPRRTSDILEKVHAKIRSAVAHYSEDRYFADDLQWIGRAVLEGTIAAARTESLFS